MWWVGGMFGSSEHWGLLYVNNQEVSDDEILAANETYGSLGELAIMSLPKPQVNIVTYNKTSQFIF